MPHNVIPLSGKYRDEPAPTADCQVSQYKLPEADRQAILAQAPSAQLASRIERMRLAFIERHGDAFGPDIEEPSADLLQQKS